MSMPFSFFRITLGLVAAAAVNGTAGAFMPAFWPTGSPVLVAGHDRGGGLVKWPIGPGPHPKGQPLLGTGHLGRGGMATDGRSVAIAEGDKLVVYDLQTMRTTNLRDPAGTTFDVAIGKNGTYYVLNVTQGGGGNVVVYPSTGTPPKVIDCALLQDPEYIAVNSRGDIYVNQNGTFTGVVEIPAGPNGPDGSQCRALHLKPGVSGYSAGIAIDPQNDDLLVLDDPDYCAGGIEGRLTTYRRPYLRSSGRSIVLGQNCSGTLRLDATSGLVFVGDSSVDGSTTYILARHYPSGAAFGAFGGGNPGGFTPVPNRLPN